MLEHKKANTLIGGMHNKKFKNRRLKATFLIYQSKAKLDARILSGKVICLSDPERRKLQIKGMGMKTPRSILFYDLL